MKEKGKKPIWKRWWFWVVVVIIIVAAANSGGNDSASKTETATATTTTAKNTQTQTAEAKEQTKPVEDTPKQKMFNAIKTLIDSKKAYDTGNYIKGDIPAGDYAFVSFAGSGKYFEEDDAANNILDNENFDSFGYVTIHDAGNIETDGVLISTSAFPELGVTGAKQIYEVLNDVQDYKGSGIYKVGIDVPAGTHVIESQGEAYVESSSGPVGNGEIIQNENFNGRYSISVTNGQYLTVSRGTIAQ